MEDDPVGCLADVEQEVRLRHVGAILERVDLAGPRRHAEPPRTRDHADGERFEELEPRERVCGGVRIGRLGSAPKIVRSPRLAPADVERCLRRRVAGRIGLGAESRRGEAADEHHAQDRR
jgi:hypothetical protein